MSGAAATRNFNEERYGAATPGDIEDDRIRTVMRLLRAYKGKRLLDVGCTDGFLSERFRKLGLYVVGVDASESAVEKARARCDEAHVGDLDRLPLPLPDGVVDGVFAGEVLEHIFRTEEFLEEMHRLTTPGGFMVLTTPNLACWANRVSLLAGYQPFFTEIGTRPSNCGHPFRGNTLYPAGHIRVMTASALRELLGRCGWELVSLHGAGMLERRGVKTLDIVISRLFPSLASDLIAVCRRT